MTAAPRLKGQEVSVVVMQDQTPLIGLFDIRSFESAELLEVLTERYLGKTTNDYDEIYNGYSFRLEAHIETRTYLDFRAAVVNKARRRTPTLRINIKFTLLFPGGPRVRVTLLDVHMGEMPLNVPGRAEYVTVALQGNGSAIQVN